MTDALPDVVWIGKVNREWPLHIFISEGHAIDWMKDRKTGHKQRRIWKVRLAAMVEYQLIAPDPYLEIAAETENNE